ncbi:MAG: endonuclease/exonuclease/phosphatase family protein [Actinomycetota bacterium]
MPDARTDHLTVVTTAPQTISLTPSVTDDPPPHVAEELTALRAALDETIPAKVLDRNLLIGTWNLRAFGGLTDEWDSGPNASPKRDLRSLRSIAEILSRFDVVALQEVKGNIKALRHTMKVLGPDWGLILTDVTRGNPGNDERMAFLFDTRRVKPSGLACELVVPKEWLDRVGPAALTEQFARTPYAASFISAKKTFILVTLHVLFGDKPADRLGELSAIAEWFAGWAKEEADWNHRLVALGDFNIDRTGDPSFDAFTSTGLTVPPELHDVPRTIFLDGDEGKHYDQIAWFDNDEDVADAPIYSGNAGTFDFTDVVMPRLSNTELSWRLSDHLPLWTEFTVRS